MNKRGKEPTSFRLSREAHELIGKLKEHLGLGRTDVVEMGIRELARKELPVERPCT